MSNYLYYGDNLDILRKHVADESVDLIYLDPPFKSNASYNVLFKERSGEESIAQIHAFEDTWTWGQESENIFHELVTNSPERLANLVQTLRSFLGTSDMMAYLTMMSPRLVELRRVLKPTGSIYLHCDPTASHYLKILIDAVFGPEQFRNEIIWRRTGAHNSSRRYGPIHDTVLFYSKTGDYYFKRIYRPYSNGHVEGYFKQEDERGRFWTNALTGAGTRNGQSGQEWHGYNPTDVGRHWAIPGKVVEELGIDETLGVHEKLDALDEAGFIIHPQDKSSAMPTYRQYLDSSLGMPIQDIWAYQPHTHGVLYGSDEGIDEDVRWLVAQGDAERLGYQTQKPVGLLKRIIQSSCPENGIVLDPFCGCGTSIAAAEQLHRQWIGIDITHLAISLIKKRLRDNFRDELAPYTVMGVPTDVAGAEALALQDRYQFQWWAIGLIDGRPAQDKKKGKDTGIDGYLFFFDDNSNKAKKIIIQVKSGKLKPDDLRALSHVVDREKAQIGVLITLQLPTSGMRKEAIAAGFYQSQWGKNPKLQILTIDELLHGKRIEYPQTINATFKEAARQKKRIEEQPTLPGAARPARPVQTRLPSRDFENSPLLDELTDEDFES